MIYYSQSEFNKDVEILAGLIKPDLGKYKAIYAIPQGGIPLGISLSHLLDIRLISLTQFKDQNKDFGPNNVLIVDDLVDSGATTRDFKEAGYDIACLHVKDHTPEQSIPSFWVTKISGWITYWWESTEERSIKDNITRILQFIGEDPHREGLIKTPERVVRSWQELFGGYKEDPASIFTTFEADGYSELVLLKGIEFFSTCEHHMLPFSGQAHIGYIANDRIIGISKLARLLDIFARRLQVQERIGQQVTKAIMQYLKPAGAACIIEAQHLCMRCRGVQKQNSIMVTSSLAGKFLEDTPSGRAARAELMLLIK
jgi:GTP cyclohydrolase IA